MKVSIIIPCYNTQRYVAEAIDSALAQTYPDKEIVVVDDGSTDGSSEVIARYASRVRIVRQANAGLAAARNSGIRASSGEVLAFLDADDWLDPGFLESTVPALTASGAEIAFCGWQNVGLPGPRGEPFVPSDYESDPRKLEVLFSGSPWPVHAAIVRRSVVDGCGGFSEKWRTCEDFAFWIRAATRHRLVRVPKALAFYRHHPGQMTRDRVRMALDHWAVQLEFLSANPAIAKALGRRGVRRLTHGLLMQRGFERYWAGDLAGSRRIFRRVLARGYGSLREWRYMLPSLLPLSWHAALLDRLRGNRHA
jgi:glycosyltransferase involved in cell wall biosynthesis